MPDFFFHGHGLPLCDGGMYNPFKVHAFLFFSSQICDIKTLPANPRLKHTANRLIYCHLVMSCEGPLRPHGEPSREPSAGRGFTANACGTARLNPANPFSLKVPEAGESPPCQSRFPPCPQVGFPPTAFRSLAFRKARCACAHDAGGRFPTGGAKELYMCGRERDEYSFPRVSTKLRFCLFAG